MRKLPLLMLTLIGVQASGGAVQVKTVVDASLLGGQNYYNGSASSLGGVAALTVAPYTQFNDQWSLVPLYTGNYRGTKQVTDLVGGGTLFQDSQDHTISAKLIRSFPNGLKVKAVSGYGVEWLRETKDEDWTKGLYDNRRLFAGTEAEWSWKRDRNVRFAYDAYFIHFPNYQSLESTQGSDLGRELSNPDTLDNNNHAFTLSSRLGLPFNGYIDLAAAYRLRSFGDQNIVAPTGDLIGETRKDSVQSLSAAGTWPVITKESRKLFTTFTYSWDHLYSNQNHYDANQFVFNGNYYAGVTNTITNQWTALFGQNDPWSLNFTGSLSRQQYADRRVQDATGVYGSDTTHVDGAYLGVGFSYPIAKGFHLAGNAYFGWNDSNNQDNRVYQYHYHTQTYLMGFTYAY
jgi:hypothetical protein